MTISSLFTEIKTKIIGSNQSVIIDKITPIIEKKFMPDLEAGEGDFYKRLNERKSELEFSSKPLNIDLEKGDNSIICGEVTIDINSYEKYKIIENYVSFMDVVNYFSTPVAERRTLSFIDDMVKNVYESNIQSQIEIDIISDNDFI